jgi:ATP phosphoribosyltransferase regulatory subunit
VTKESGGGFFRLQVFHMAEPLSKIPDGMRYYFGREARLRRSVEEIVMSVFDGWSYEEITTPTVDYYSLFEHSMGSDQAHRAFRFTDTDGRLLALRPDVTSGVARAAVTMFAERDRPLRLCYAARVFRQRPQSHAEWRRESTQTGCELIGANTGNADMEMLAIASEVLHRLELGGNHLITLNDVGIFKGIAARLALDAVPRDQMRQLVDSRNAADLERFLVSHAFAPEECRALVQLTQLSGKRETLESARRVITNAASIEALDRLDQLWGMIESLDLAEHFEIDLGDVAKLDYYTGLTFSIYVNGAPSRVGSGGRYDGLTAAFGKAEPAVGFVLDLDALTTVLLASREDSNLASEPEPKMAAAIASEPSLLFREARKKRAEGERVLINLER